MITFISFADNKYQKTLERIKQEALSSNFFDEVKIFTESDLPDDIRNYCNTNGRGYGYWIWKPYFVNKVLNEIKDDDILIYCDAGCTINPEGKERFNHYIELIKNDDNANISFQMNHLEKRFSKGDLFKYFDSYDQLDTGQIANCTIILRKNKHTSDIVKLWYETCVNKKNLIDDSGSIYPNDPIFFDHRHDQSVFSIIRKKYGTIFLDDETYKLNNDGSFNMTYPFHCSRIKF